MSAQAPHHDPDKLELLVLRPPGDADPLHVLAALGFAPHRRGSSTRVEDLLAAGHCAAIERPGELWLVLPGHFALAADSASASALKDFSPQAWAKVDATDGHGETVVWGSRPQQSARESLESACGLGLAELLRLEATELLPRDYALDADTRVRVPATPDPSGEAKLVQQMLIVLLLALAGAGLWFVLGG